MTSLDTTFTSLAVALGSAAVKATAILAFATLVAHMLRRRAAALRHLVWIAALGSVVAVLLLPAALPAWRVIPLPSVSFSGDALPTQSTGASQLGQARSVPAQRRDVSSLPKPTTPGVAMSAGSSTPIPGGTRWSLVMLAIWLTGVAVVVARLAWSRFALRRLARSSAESAESRALVEHLSRRMHITRAVALRSSDDIELPLTWGVFRPEIVLPSDACEWTAECRRHVIEHEMAHIKRLDAATQVLAQAASALFWFHPLVWYAAERMRCERERACDDYVLANGAVPSDYAGDLLALVTTRGYVERHSAALAFAKRSHFEGRLLALLDTSIDRGTLSAVRVAQVLTVSAAVVVPVAAVRGADARVVQHAAPIVAPQHQTSLTPAAKAAVPTSTVRTIVRNQPAPTLRSTAHVAESVDDDVFAGCGTGGMNHHSHADASDGIRHWTATGGNDICLFELAAEGGIVFNSTATGIERLSPGSYVDVKTELAGETTHLVVGASVTGEPTYELVRDGRSESSPNGQRWLEQFLIGLDRITAFAMNDRLPAILATSGPAGVLADIDHMHSDYAKTQYLRRLAEAAPLDANALRHAGQIVASMRPDYETGQVVTAIARRYSLEDPFVRATFLSAALALNSEHEQVEALLAILGKTSLDRQETDVVRAAAMRMRPEGEATRLLRALARQDSRIAR